MRLCIGLIACLTLAACQMTARRDMEALDRTAPTLADEGVQTSALGPAPAASSAGRPSSSRDIALFPGGSPIRPAGQNGVRIAPGNQVEIDLVSVDVETAAQAILGDLLKVNFTVDPKVTGTITVRTPTPVNTTQAVALLENALGQNGAALVQKDGAFSIVPTEAGKTPAAALAVRSGGANAEVGYGSRAVSLKHVAAKEMAELIQQLQPDAVVRIDNERNVLVLRGSGADFNALMETVRTFDVDWLANKSVGLFRIETMPAEVMNRSLAEILANENINGSIARVSVLDANNALLVVAKSPQVLGSIRRWIQRLDRPSASAFRLFTYEMRHARAAQVAPLIAGGLGLPVVASAREAAAGRAGERNGGGLAGSGLESSAGGGIGPGTGRLTSGTGSTSTGGGGVTPGSSGGGGIGAGSGVSPGRTARASSNGPVDPARALLQQGGAGLPAAGGGGENPARIVVDDVSNKLLVYATAAQFDKVKEFLRTLDIPEKQVLVEATIIEVALTDELRYGAQYYIDRVINGTTLKGNLIPGSGGTSGLQAAGASLAVGLSSQAIIDTLNQVTRVNVVSSPNLMVVNNQSARLIVGDQVPVTRQTRTDTGSLGNAIVNSIDFRDTGIIFDVTPRVSASGNIMLDIIQEVSSVKRGGQTLTPTISQRRLNSVVTAANNETVVLGGLFSTDLQSTNGGLPFLADVPVLGGVFGTQSRANNKTELLVLISAQIVNDRTDARNVTRQMKDRIEKLRLVETVPCKRNANCVKAAY